METKNMNLQNGYVAPKIEVLEVLIEKGFEGSLQDVVFPTDPA